MMWRRKWALNKQMLMIRRLKEYREKRNFEKTNEPMGEEK